MEKEQSKPKPKDYLVSLLSQLNEFREKSQFTDVTLICENIAIKAHKNILSAASPYFLAMFGGNFPEAHGNEVKMQEIDADCLKAIIDFIYTANLHINEENVQQLYETSTFLQLEKAIELCAGFIILHLQPDNCLGFKQFAEKHNNQMLLEAAKDFIVTHFHQVVQNEEFLEMSYEEVKSILKSDMLYVHSDDAVLRGLVRWAEYKSVERLSVLSSLLFYIHPACVTGNVARSLRLLKKEDESNKWLERVLNCEKNLEWCVFLLDKMGNEPDMMFQFNLKFEDYKVLKPLPRPAFAVSLAAYKNILYVQGGSKGRSSRDSFYYNIYRDQWYELQPLLIERSHHRSLVLNEYLYALGGNSLKGATSTVECLNLLTNKATFKENMQAKRSSMGAVVCENVLYAMGGETDNLCLYSMERYDPRVGVWENLPPMHEVNSYCSSAVINRNIYCCEGLGNCMERFDLRANSWELIDLSATHEFYEIFAVDNKLYSTSGETICKYDTLRNQWCEVYKYPRLRNWDTALGLQMLNGPITTALAV